jgi:hypothetical protein
MIKSANQMWRESKTTLSFKEWLEREKEKYANADGLDESKFIPNAKLNSRIEETINEIRKSAGYKEVSKKNTVFGLNQTVLLVAGVIIIGAIGYQIYKNYKK